MEIRHIHYFIAVAENLSFTKAAQQLMIAQPPLSRQIKDLEDELGAALFDRSPHGLHITPEGEAFLEYALRIMDLVKKSREHIAEMSKGLQGTLYIASVEGHAPRLLAEWIADYKTEHPHVDYTLRNGSTDDVIYWVTNGLCELGVITEPSASSRNHTMRRVFFPYRSTLSPGLRSSRPPTRLRKRRGIPFPSPTSPTGI